MYDSILRNGMIYDGGTEPAYKADLAIRDGKIVKIAPSISEPAAEVIDVTGLAVAPGFIDMHSHGDCTFLLDDKSESKITQGVTSELAGQCGATIYPARKDLMHNLYNYVSNNEKYDAHFYTSESLAEFIGKVKATDKKMSTNLIPLIGHGALRCGVMGFSGEPADEAQRAVMCELMDEAMQQGAWGISLGLGYTPGVFADQNELNALGAVISKYDGIITSHMRDQGPKIFDALEEMYEINRKTGVKVHIAHLKMSGKKQFGRAAELLEHMEAARAAGIRLSADMYPYTASSTGITNIMPKWTLEGGVAKAAERLAGEHHEELMADLQEKFAVPSDGEALYIITTNGRYPIADDKNIYELSQELGVTMAEAVAKVIIETKGATSCIFVSMSEEDVDLLLRQNWVSIGSDGSGYPFDIEKCGGKLHPRNFGTFPRVLRLVREQKICSLEEAVNRMTKLTADTLGLRDRGQLKEGLVADITVFNPETVTDRSTFKNPFQKSEGIEHVLIGGKFALKNGVQTEQRLGEFVLKK